MKVKNGTIIFSPDEQTLLQEFFLSCIAEHLDAFRTFKKFLNFIVAKNDTLCNITGDPFRDGEAKGRIKGMRVLINEIEKLEKTIRKKDDA